MALLPHFGAAFAFRPLAPKVPLWVFIIAALFLDVLCIGIFLPLGIDKIKPLTIYWSHGLVMSAVWSLVGGLAAGFAFRDARGGIFIGLAVFSHWVLDFISHPMTLGRGPSTPDIPLFFAGSPNVGLGLYTTLPGAIISELVLLLAGLAVYILWLRKRRAEKKAN